MSPMLRTILTVLVGLALATLVALAGEALDFSGLAYFAALLAIGLLISLTDPTRFGWR